MSKSTEDELAWYWYPEPKGTSYDARALSTANQVQEVFDYCQIGLAIIHKEGWRFLFKTYGLSGILAINEQSGWFDTESHDAMRQDLFYYSLIAGYSPIKDEFGIYDEQRGYFIPVDGSEYEIYWSSWAIV
jgi:hypothetical protein